MKKSRILTILLAGVLMLAGCAGGQQATTPPAQATPEEPTPAQDVAEPTPPPEPGDPSELIQTQPPQPGDPIAVMETNMGTVRIRLFPQYAPVTVENFIGLAEQGAYDGLIFHRVINNFMIQGGCPEGTGRGGMSIFLDEDGEPMPFQDEPSDYLWNFRGALSMANAGPNTNRSQFFIVQDSGSMPQNMIDAMREFGYPESAIAHYDSYGGTPHLDGNFLGSQSLHTVFGHVIEGMDIVDAIAAVPVVNPMNDHRPIDDVVLISVTIETAE